MLLVLAFMASDRASAQRFYVQLSGVVTDHFTGHPLKGVMVRLLKAGLTEAEVITRRDGRYSFQLDRGWRYALWYSKADLVGKHVDINTEEIPPYPDVPFYEMDVQMTLFPWINDFDFSAFDGPLGMASYKESVRNMSWDVDFTNETRPALVRVMAEYTKSYNGYYKRTGHRKKEFTTRQPPRVNGD